MSIVSLKGFFSLYWADDKGILHMLIKYTIVFPNIKPSLYSCINDTKSQWITFFMYNGTVIKLYNEISKSNHLRALGDWEVLMLEKPLNLGKKSWNW